MMNAVMAKMSVRDLLYVRVLYKQYKYTTLKNIEISLLMSITFHAL